MHGYDYAWTILAVALIVSACAAIGAALTSRGAHAGGSRTAGLDAASPAPSPAGSMFLEADREAWDAHIQANLFPGPARDGTLLLDAGAWEAGPMLDEPWAPYEANGYKNPTAGGPAPAVADSAGPGLASSLPGPAEPTRLASEDTEFRAILAADVLAYERRQTAGAWEFTARLADWADSYLREVRTAL